jgi:predicted O-methyltransferase YrrM
MDFINYLQKIHKLNIRECSTNTDFETIIGLLKQIASPGMQAIEIGCWKGSITGAMCQIIKPVGGTLHCIDPWAHEIENLVFDDIFNIFQNNMLELGLTDTIKIYKESSLTAHNHFSDESIDFIFIDGLHMYNYFHNDLINFYPKLKKGGIISGHDCNVRFEMLSPEGQKEVDENINVDCVTIKEIGRGAHCGVTKAIYEVFGTDYRTNEDDVMNSVWWRIK